MGSGIPVDNFGESVDSSCLLIPTQECSANEISCDMGTTEKGCWLGNYCSDMLLGCPSCSPSQVQLCTENEISCDMGTLMGCWMGNYCIDKGMGPCIDQGITLDDQGFDIDQGIPLDDQGFDIDQGTLDDFIDSATRPVDPSCTLIFPKLQFCTENEISCDMTSEKGCWLGNYCSDKLLGCPDFGFVGNADNVDNVDQGIPLDDLGFDSM